MGAGLALEAKYNKIKDDLTTFNPGIKLNDISLKVGVIF